MLLLLRRRLKAVIAICIAATLFSLSPVIAQSCGCASNMCCSQYGYCGTGDNYCGQGCKQGPCYSSGPDIIVTGGYYPVTWTASTPPWWSSWNGITPQPVSYDVGQIFDQFWKDILKLFHIATLENPAAKVKIGPNLPGHMINHVYGGSGGSVFSQKYSDPIHLLALIAYGVTKSVPRTVSPNLLVYEVPFMDTVGTTYGANTSVYSIVVFNTNQIEDGMPIYYVTNMFPGTYKP